MSATATVTGLRQVDITPERLAQVTQTLAEHAPVHDRDGSFPHEGVQAVHAAGILTATVAPEYGGRGLSAREQVDVFLALGAGDPSVALLTANTLFAHGGQAYSGTFPEALYEQILQDSLERPVLFNAIRAEPELGAPARGGLPKTTARRTDSGWVLNGHKAWGTGSDGIDFHLVWAVSDDDDPIIGHVVVPRETPGVSVVETWDHLGMRATRTHDVVYTDVEVPFDHFNGTPVNAPLQRPTGGGQPFGGGLAAFYLGVAKAALEAYVDFTNERIPSALGKPISTLERIQTVAGEAQSLILQAELSLIAAAEAADRGFALPSGLGLLKTIVSRNAIAAVQLLSASIGNPGLTRSLPFERHLRDVLCSRPHPPQDDAALLGAGRALLLSSP